MLTMHPRIADQMVASHAADRVPPVRSRGKSARALRRKAQVRKPVRTHRAAA